MIHPRKPVWTEGLFMTPQHLQQSDLYHEALLQARVQAALSYGWGSTNSLLLLRDTRDQLFSHNGLSSFNVPQTIADSIEFSKNVSTRWATASSRRRAGSPVAT